MATSNFSSLFKEVEGNYWNLGCIHSPTGPSSPSGGPSRSFPIKFPGEVFSNQCHITRAKGCQTQGKGHHQVQLVSVDRWFLRMRTLASHHHDEPTTPPTKTTPQQHEEAAATRRRKYKEQACFFFFFTMASCGTCMRYCAWGRRRSRDFKKLSWRAAGGSPVTAIARRQEAISRRRERQRCTKERQRSRPSRSDCSSDSVGWRRKHWHKGGEKRKQIIISRWRRQIYRRNSLNIQPERRGALWGWKGKNQQMCARSLRGTVKALDARKRKDGDSDREQRLESVRNSLFLEVRAVLGDCRVVEKHRRLVDKSTLGNFTSERRGGRRRISEPNILKKLDARPGKERR